jgi:BirA family biotin operon repressor/biotin-[acetyl-CoA-carboxylase] ligase
VAEALNELYGIKAETKWPNDVLVDGRKICGILAEMSTVGERVKFVVLGLGVNANLDVEKDLPKELLENTTSLKAVLRRKVGLEELFKRLLEKLDDVYEHFLEEGFHFILKRWKSYARFIGHIVEVKSEGEKLSGLALDVNGEGALVIKLRDGTVRRVFVGDLSIK